MAIFEPKSQPISPFPESEAAQPKNTRRLLVWISLGLIIVLGAFLRFYELGAYSIGNAYYAATVKSMLTSWHNFFYAAFEPGGSVSVDKPPLGFWIQAASAAVFGVNGFALAFPQALAGVISIPLLYALVKRPFGEIPGLLAALVLAVIPVTIATERNNTIDGLLVLVLLLATWAFLRAVRTGRLRDLLLGAVLIGAGFNIKMLQAYMILPALYLVYLLGSRLRWWKRFAYLGVATVVMLVVSLSWAVIVDLTPASSRPYVGSSTNNTEMELIVGHNGVERLTGMVHLNNDGGSDGLASSGDMQPPSLQSNQAPPGMSQGLPPRQADGAGGPPDAGVKNGNNGRTGSPPGDGGNGGQRADEVGTAGFLRLFTAPLADEASWLLPLAILGGLAAFMVLGWRWPLTERHLAILLWGGWLGLTGGYFSFTTGLFHTYYLIMLGPAIAALVGVAFWAMQKVVRSRPALGWILVAGLTGVCLAFEILVLRDQSSLSAAIPFLIGTSWLVGIVLLAFHQREWFRRAAWVLVVVSLLVGPMVWSGLTTFNTNPEVSLPHAGPTTGGGQTVQDASTLTAGEQAILDILLENAGTQKYLVGAGDSHTAAPYILATGLPVLTFGGFNGGDNVVDAAGLAEMVQQGEIRFILGSGIQQNQELGAWLTENCTVVDVPGIGTPSQPANSMVNFGNMNTNQLYDCGKS